MSYIFDIYRGVQKPVRNFTEYAVFVSFFPLLVAGPIERASHLLPQVQRPRFFDYTQAKGGAKLILWGMCKKILVADSLSKIVEHSFSNYQELNSISLIVGAVAFSFQIYCDFSGYSDIAIGTAKLFGFELLSNFKFPYFSRNLAEFWRRWHISLSSWFRDYLYIPLGGSKKGILFTIRNVFLVFIISGFWHGANWKFIIWGAIHACGFLPLLLLNKNRLHLDGIVAEHSKLPSFKELGSMILTFSFVTFAWVFFRADDISHAYSYLYATVSNFGSAKSIMNATFYESFLYLIPFMVVDWHFRRNDRDVHLPIKNSVLRTLVYMVVVLLLFYHLLLSENSSFIYFQF
jgi:D-alanyl-lipoteichoic acid acyltransferase DltB (MBOAT superfamily)